MKPLLSLLLILCTPLYPQSWDHVIKSVASDRGADDQFGFSVAVSGDYAIIGAFTEDHDAAGANAVSDAGSAYIFHWDGTTWTQQQKLVPSHRNAQDHFGYSVGISGDYAIIGARWDNLDASGANSLSDAGSAYIFVRSGSTWTQQQKLVASDRAAVDEFGWAVAIAGDYAIVGAPSEDHDAAGANFDWETGSAYIFVRSGSTWTQQQKIVAGDRGYTDQFGKAVSLSGDFAMIGTYGDEKDASGANPLASAGSAYIFVRSGSTWSQQQKLVASDRAENDFFGYAVSISGEYAIAGASQHDAGASNAGAAYIFLRSGSEWTEQQKINAGDREASDNFGGSVAISGAYAVVGAAFEDPSSVSNAGSAYVFSRSGTVWSQQQKLNASDAAADDQYARSVALSGGHLLVGAWYEDHDAAGNNLLGAAGSAYFRKNPELLPAVIPQQSVSLDGTDDFVTMGLHDDHKLTTALTVEAWIKPSRNNGYEGIANNIHWTNVQTSGYGLFMGGFNAVDKVEFIIMNSSTSGYQELLATLPGLNSWHHVAGTYDGAMMRLYIDGVQKESLAVSGAVAHTYSTAWKVGAYIDDNESHYFQGYIDDVRLWNVVRTSAQIANNRSVELLGNESGLIGYWKFNEGTGTTADDATLYSHDGTLTNGAGWPGETGMPVELTAFTAAARGRSVELQWTTATEVNNAGFEVQRSESDRWRSIGWVDGQGMTNAPLEYSFVDRSASFGYHRYRLKQVDRDGRFEYSQEVEVTVAPAPARFELSQNYPNPFNPATTIGFTLQQTGWTTLIVYNVVGQEVVTLVHEVRDAGVFHEVHFDAGDHASGLYFVRLVSSGNTLVRKIVLLK